MGLFDFIRGLFGGTSSSTERQSMGTGLVSPPEEIAVPARSELLKDDPPPVAASISVDPPRPQTYRKRKKGTNVSLRELEYRSSMVPTPARHEVVNAKPYRFAIRGVRHGQYLDLSRDADPRWLEYFGLPQLATPDDLATWLGMPIGRLAWLTHHMRPGRRPQDAKDAHYHYQWKKKRSGGWRLIEAPKEELKAVQKKILHEILDLVPAHPSAHGFVTGRSILSNAAPHVGNKFVLKLDLENFYTTVKYSRVVALFRSLGFSREVSLWLARLTVSAPPWNLSAPTRNSEFWQAMTHHLPQGAPTSPALANLSAFGLDVRLSGLAKAYNLKYTRYADDLTFSGPGMSIPALNDFIPLATKIIVSERFYVNKRKRKLIRESQRQCVTGVVVNEKLNVSRVDFDRLKATLYNCVKHGPESQNRNQHPDFAAHLRGRIAHVMQLNAERGEKLLGLYQQIRW